MKLCRHHQRKDGFLIDTLVSVCVFVCARGEDFLSLSLVLSLSVFRLGVLKAELPAHRIIADS